MAVQFNQALTFDSVKPAVSSGYITFSRQPALSLNSSLYYSFPTGTIDMNKEKEPTRSCSTAPLLPLQFFAGYEKSVSI